MICNIKFSSSRDDMLKMLDAGMNIASFNFTLGDQKVSSQNTNDISFSLTVFPLTLFAKR